jgi:dUTP pyrophosphatase
VSQTNKLEQPTVAVLKNLNAFPLVYAKRGDSCADIRASVSCSVEAKSTGIVPTSIFLSLPEGWEGSIRGRSGLASKGIFPVGGVIDSGYRGEVGVILYNSTDEVFIIERGDKIAQIEIRPVVQARFLQVEKLDDSDRGQAGFGSTGK